MSRRESLQERIQAASSRTNWSDVSNTDARSFALGLELQEEAEVQLDRRRVAWATAAGGVISLCVVSLFALATTKSAEFTLGLVIVHQLVRQFILWWKNRQAMQLTRRLQLSTLETAMKLSQEFPA